MIAPDVLYTFRALEVPCKGLFVAVHALTALEAKAMLNAPNL